MSTTDELRRMLDERGVEWDSEDRRTNMQTYWGDWCFMEPLDAKPHTLGAQCELMLIPATPEQAIAATLGGDDSSRYSELFGTPERAADTITRMQTATDLMGVCDADTCPAASDGCWQRDSCPMDEYDALLEWLRGDAE